MKKLLLIGAALVAGLLYYTNPTDWDTRQPADSPVELAAQDAGVAESETDAAYDGQRSNVQVRGSGAVSRLLPDDNDGSRHQRFILKLDSGLTVLVAHNVDLAPRIDSLQEGDEVEYYGEYEWNGKGGVVHWTHHDPRGSHVGGWLKHKGRTYQ